LQVLVARQVLRVLLRDRLVRVAPQEHGQQLAHLIDVVASQPVALRPVGHRRRDEPGVEDRGGRLHAGEHVPGDAEVPQLQPPLAAHEDVHRRDVSVQRPAAVQLVEQLQQGRDLPGGPLRRPRLAGRGQVIPDRPAVGQFEHQAVEDLLPLLAREQGEGLEHADGPVAALEQLAEVRFVMPASRVGGDFQAQVLEPPLPRAEPVDAKGAAETALAQHLGDAEALVADGTVDVDSRLDSFHGLASDVSS
jgi:hypothetical protein